MTSRSMQYRERDRMEAAIRRRHDQETRKKWMLKQLNSPYKFDMSKHRERTGREFWASLEERERRERKERWRDDERYEQACRESVKHESRLLKRDANVTRHGLRAMVLL